MWTSEIMGTCTKFYALYEVKPGLDHALVEDSIGFTSIDRVKQYRRRLAMAKTITGIHTTLDNVWPSTLPGNTKLVMEKPETSRRSYTAERNW